ncbi:MAG: ABC transporter ATP-binding protein [Candidatus Thorarchaeota archaeon]
MTETDGNVVELRDLTKYYGKIRGIEDLTLTIKKGRIFGFLGPNGAGKTTTIRCLLGIINKSRGNVRIFDQEIANWDSNYLLKEKIGYLPGDFDLYRHFSVKEMLDYFAALRKKPISLRAELVTRFDLDETRRVHQLSKGNRQKVGLVQALMHDPDLVILDEPTAGLDPLMQTRLYKVLTEFKSRGKTIFFSSHNLDEVQKICDEVAIIKEGKLVSHDLIEQLSEKIPRKMIVSLGEIGRPEDLAKIPYVSTFKPASNSDGRKYELWFDKPNPDFSAIFRVLQDLNLPLGEVTIPAPSLEDYFMQYYEEPKEG